ncbi:serine hydrolase [Thioclava sp. A2]|uniref:serine hydrolase domain-containing protein n=1 Tax=Thioclava sp. FCG-A2 TaxID=3080562 RepID=UPI002953946B|nr:serine hydrolase [Thioclava sp. A2]MDV7271042.1 serine hydrolase [Thioclava sp. A2]
MRVVRIVLRVVLLLTLLAGAAAVWKRDEISRLLAVNSLFAPENIVANFSSMPTLFFHRTLDRGEAKPMPLPEGGDITLPAGVDDWIERRAVTAMVVLQDGRLVHERYFRGTSPEDLRISWSVAKSVLSALFGVLHSDGTIPDLKEQVTKFAPLLVGSAYDGATIHDVLTMSSGVAFNEDYFDYNSDINRMGRVLALGGALDEFAASLKERATPPGSHMHYVSIDTHVLGMVIKGATGKDPAELMSDRIVKPLGLEAAPVMLTDSGGTSFVLGGLNLRTRDYARIGQMFLQLGNGMGQQIVPQEWVQASTRLQAPGGAGYGYQWWVPKDTAAHGNDYFAHGIYGQYIYVNPEARMVIAVNSADLGFREDGVDDENLAMLRAIAQAG